MTAAHSVVVVEDDPATADLLRDLLEPAGCAVECIADGSTAVARIARGGVDLVLLDLMLPSIGGLEVCRRVRAREHAVYLPIILLTALTAAAQRLEGYAAGADDYVTKPFDTAELVARVQVWLRTRTRLKIAHQRLLREQRALRDSQHQQRLIIEAANDAFIGMDANGTITDWNHQAEVTFGLARAEAVGRPLAELIVPPEYREPYERLTQHVLNRHEGPLLHRRVECTLLDHHGEARPVELTLWPVAVGESYSFNAFARDLSERKRAEEVLLRSVRELEEARGLESVGRLVAGVAHDFNNLLTAINGFNGLLLGQLAPTDPRRGYAEEVGKAGESAAALASQLLAVSRRSARPEVLDLNAVVTEVEGLLRRLIGEDVALRTRLSDAPALVRADHGRLEQVVLNLAVNARDAMPRGGTLTIEVALTQVDDTMVDEQPPMAPGAYVRVSVRDTGCGMDPAVQARAFEPFFSTKEEGKGTGLGLAIVAGVVQEIGGHVRLESQPGAGTALHVYLRQAEPAAAPAPPAAAPAAPPRGTETVLVVEDDDRVRLLVRVVLATSGYQVLDARDAAEALSRAARHAGPIHLLLLDVVLPGPGGDRLVRQLAAGRPAPRVLYTSGYSEEALSRHGPRAADAPLLPKPFGPDALLHAVRQALDVAAPPG